MRNILLAWLIVASPMVSAGAEPTKSEVLKNISEKLFAAYKEGSKNNAVKPRVILDKPRYSTQSLAQPEIESIVNQFQEKLVSVTVLLDRANSPLIATETQLQQSGAVRNDEAIALGKKQGAEQVIILSFSDTVAVTGIDEEKVEVRATLTAIEIETQRIVIMKTTQSQFEHRTLYESYPIRDTVSFVSGIGVWSGAIGAVAFVGKAYLDKNNYDKAKSASDAKSHRESTEQDKTLAGACLGIGTVSFLAKWYLDGLRRNFEGRNEFELLTGLDNQNGNNGYLMGFTWSK